VGNNSPIHKEWELLGPTIFLMMIGYLLVETKHPVLGYGLFGLCLCQKHELRVVWIIKALIALGFAGLIYLKGGS